MASPAEDPHRGVTGAAGALERRVGKPPRPSRAGACTARSAQRCCGSRAASQSPPLGHQPRPDRTEPRLAGSAQGANGLGMGEKKPAARLREEVRSLQAVHHRPFPLRQMQPDASQCQLGIDRLQSVERRGINIIHRRGEQDHIRHLAARGDFGRELIPQNSRIGKGKEHSPHKAGFDTSDQREKDGHQ